MTAQRFMFNAAAARAAGRNGGARRNSGFWYYVNGEPVKMAEIAARVGVSIDVAKDRVARERARGPLTWAGLSARDSKP